MQFSAAALVSFAMVTLALALPMDATVAERNVVARDLLNVYSDVGTVAVKLDAADLATTNAAPVADASVAVTPSSLQISTRDVALVPRVTIGDAASAVAIVNGIIAIATSADKFVQGIIDADIKRRQQFTQRTIGSLRSQFPHTNFVMSNVGYAFNGPMITRRTVFYHNHVGAKVSYDVIAFNHATFDLHGDGGFQNWAYGVDRSCKTGGGHIQC